MFGKPLPRIFYSRSSLVVAPELLNCILVRVTHEGITAGRIAETEAYTQDDAASHAYRGKTTRNAVMFGQAGVAYVYFTYGMHYCLNAVTGLEGQGEAVLIRAIEPLLGLELMRRRRGLSDGPGQFEDSVRGGSFLGGGPARLCQALGVSARENGDDLTCAGEMWISAPPVGQQSEFGSDIVSTPRIGITKAADLNRRFTIRSDPFASRVSKKSSV